MGMMPRHEHLATDADQRANMIETYLALKEGDALPQESQISHLFDAIFRPVSTGIVKDDGVPISLFDYLTQQRGK